MPEYPKEQVWRIYEQLPDDLKEAIFSEETAEHIRNVCAKNGIEDPEKIASIARLTGNVLLGLVMPDEIQSVLEKELGLEKDIAKKVSFGIHRFVFFPVRESLSALYQMEIVPPGLIRREEKVPEEKKPSREDVYREPIE